MKLFSPPNLSGNRKIISFLRRKEAELLAMPGSEERLEVGNLNTSSHRKEMEAYFFLTYPTLLWLGVQSGMDELSTST